MVTIKLRAGKTDVMDLIVVMARIQTVPGKKQLLDCQPSEELLQHPADFFKGCVHRFQY